MIDGYPPPPHFLRFPFFLSFFSSFLSFFFYCACVTNSERQPVVIVCYGGCSSSGSRMKRNLPSWQSRDSPLSLSLFLSFFSFFTTFVISFILSAIFLFCFFFQFKFQVSRCINIYFFLYFSRQVRFVCVLYISCRVRECVQAFRKIHHF